ncbi:MAG: winged helix-turn-helix domain-containing protein [Pseudomonadota bacterium]
MRILLIEDDQETADFVARGLRERGDVIDHVLTGRDGMFMAMDGDYDVMIVDRLLPGMDGMHMVKLLREAECQTPVLFLSALSGLNDRIMGLDAGGDDYLVKPFAFSELAARLRALVRRRPLAQQADHLIVEDLMLDRLSRRVMRAGCPIELQPREFRLLEFLMMHTGEVVTRTMLLENVWEYHFDPKTSVVETHISRLRAKIDKPFAHELIKTVRGAGYTLAV